MGERRMAGGWDPERDNGNGARRAESGDLDLIGFGAVRLDDGIGESGEIIKPDEILYAFTAGAVEVAAEGRRRQAIMAKWTKKLRFSPGTVFLRTRAGVYRSYLRTLREFKRKVSGRRFVSVSQSVVANLDAVNSVNLARERIKTLSYDVEESELSWAVEFVTVSREHLQRIRIRFAMPKYPRAHA
jgi:hypothetical protein